MGTKVAPESLLEALKQILATPLPVSISGTVSLSPDTLATSQASYIVITAGTGYSIDDHITATMWWDVTNITNPAFLIAAFYNWDTGLEISPNIAHLSQVQEDGLTSTQLLAAGLATSIKQDTTNAALVSLLPQTRVSTTALASSLVAKASSGILYSISGTNTKASLQYIQVHNTVSLPADGAVPVSSFIVQPNSSFSFDVAGLAGYTHDTGIVVCNSSTLATKTIGSVDCWFEVGIR